MASRRKSKGVKLVALIIVLAMVVALLTTGIYALFGGTSGSGVEGTYKMSDGSKMALDSSGTATITIPSSNQSLPLTYSVQGNTVTLRNPQNGKTVTYTFKDNTLTSTEGTQTEVWVKQ